MVKSWLKVLLYIFEQAPSHIKRAQDLRLIKQLVVEEIPIQVERFIFFQQK